MLCEGVGFVGLTGLVLSGGAVVGLRGVARTCSGLFSGLCMVKF